MFSGVKFVTLFSVNWLSGKNIMSILWFRSSSLWWITPFAFRQHILAVFIFAKAEFATYIIVRFLIICCIIFCILQANWFIVRTRSNIIFSRFPAPAGFGAYGAVTTVTMLANVCPCWAAVGGCCAFGMSDCKLLLAAISCGLSRWKRVRRISVYTGQPLFVSTVTEFLHIGIFLISFTFISLV